MDVYRRYFRVTEGTLINEIEKIKKINKAAQNEYRRILKNIGANPSKYYHVSQRLTGIIFDDAPDSRVYRRKKHGGWYPKKNCALGKQIAKKIEAVRTQDPQSALISVGLSAHPTIFANGKSHWPTIAVIPEDKQIVYVSVPWIDEDPKKLKKYVKDREKNIHFNLSYDSLLWEPTNDMTEVKGWEVDKHIDEWNQKIKT
jgi:hypothetical protein